MNAFATSRRGGLAADDRRKEQGGAVAAFKEHVTFSSLIGVGFAAGAWQLGVEWSHAALAGVLSGFSGMLPDLDSASGKPVREIFGVTAAAVPMLALRRWHDSSATIEAQILLALAIYLAIRFGGAWLLGRLTVHRGMFHSIPAAFIAAGLALLTHDCDHGHGDFILAGGILLGYLSHLVLDEIYSVDMRGLSIKLNKSAGTALKLFSPSAVATLCTWAILGAVAYAISLDRGWIGADYAPDAIMASFPTDSHTR
jgi:membrane-bound metal-dependent hydrolase YbcI (DUF457 family)